MKRALPLALRLALAATVLTATARAATASSVFAAGQPIRVLCLGDSIAAGWDLVDPEREAYPALVGQLLAIRFPQNPVRVTAAGVPGDTTAGGLVRLPDLLSASPADVVVIQFGGNDKGRGDGLGGLLAYRQNLADLIHAARLGGCIPVLCTPPMNEPQTGLPYPQAAAEVASAEAVALADFDGALKAQPIDFRGLFPYGIHPQAYGHCLMANELYRAILRAVGVTPTLEVALAAQDITAVAPGGSALVTLAVRNSAPTAETVTVSAGEPHGWTPAPLVVEPGERCLTQVGVAIPDVAPLDASLDWPVVVVARASEELAPLAVRVSTAPLVTLATGQPPVEVRLSGHHLTIGDIAGWRGDRDLSALVKLWRGEAGVGVVVEVTDDRVVLAGSMPQTDGIEVYLDLRADGQRGRPIVTGDCPILFIQPTDGAEPTVTRLGPAPDGDPWSRLPVGCQQTPNGYRLELMIPFDLWPGADPLAAPALGLDVAVDDADGGPRRQQLVWSGRGDTYLNPFGWAEVRNSANPAVPHGPLRVCCY